MISRKALVGANELVAAVETFLADDVDRPRRVQALTAAALGIVYGTVLVRRLNDPSRDFPGDVQAMDTSAHVIVSAEARAKPVPESDVRTFVNSLRHHGIGRGFIVALDPNHTPLPRLSLQRWAWSEQRVILRLIESSADLLHEALAWAPVASDEALARFPEEMARQLESIGATAESQARWKALCSAAEDASRD